MSGSKRKRSESEQNHDNPNNSSSNASRLNAEQDSWQEDREPRSKKSKGDNDDTLMDMEQSIEELKKKNRRKIFDKRC